MSNELIQKNAELGRFLFCERYTLQPVKNALYIAEGQDLKRGAVVDVNGVLVGTNSLMPYAVLENDCDTRAKGAFASVFVKGEFNFDKLFFADGLSKEDLDNIVYNGSGLGIVIKPYEYAEDFSPLMSPSISNPLMTKNETARMINDAVSEVTLDPSAVAFGNAHLLDEVTEFAADAGIIVDSETNGPCFMEADTLLELTAQNALAGNVAPNFDPTKPNDEGGYAYYAGSNVTFNGKNYVFIVNHPSGAWNPMEVEQKPLSEGINTEGVGEAVYEWLNEHPEATTTVQDGSLTEVKFSDSLKLKTVKDYVTPEMFGAKGDGVEDDTQSVIDAVASGKNLLLVGVYRITSLVKIPRTCKVFRTTGSFSVDAFDTDTQTGGWVFFSYPELPVTPEMFGAVGDGVADDTKAIQNAIDANLDPSVFPIGKTQAEAGMVHTKHSALTVVLTNTYKTSDVILVRAEQHFNPLVIDGGKKANIVGASMDDADYINYGIKVLKPDNYPQGDIDTQTRKHIYGLGFMRYKNAVYFDGTDWDSSVEHCFFQDISVNAIYLRENDGTLVKDNYCSWVCGRFIHLWYSNACRVIGNHSGEYGANPPGGILVEYGTNSPNIITDNVLKGCGITIQNRNNIGDIVSNNVIKNTLSSAGITIPSSAVGVNINGNTLMNCTIGVDIFGKQTLKGNTFVGCAIGAKLDGYQHTRIVVDDNDFEKCTTGIYHVADSWDNVFKNNVFRENTTAIEAAYTSMKSVVDGNFFIECTHLYSYTPSSGGNDPIFGTNYSTQNGFETGSLTEPI